MKINKDELTKRGICQEGIDAYKRVPTKDLGEAVEKLSMTGHKDWIAFLIYKFDTPKNLIKQAKLLLPMVKDEKVAKLIQDNIDFFETMGDEKQIEDLKDIWERTYSMAVMNIEPPAQIETLLTKVERLGNPLEEEISVDSQQRYRKGEVALEVYKSVHKD